MENYLKDTFSLIYENNYEIQRLPVETGRWQGKPLGESLRFCTLCNSCQIRDELHYILECDTIQNIRKYFLCKYYYQRFNIIKFTLLMSTHYETILEKICMFIVKYMMLSVFHDTPFYSCPGLVIRYLNCLWPVSWYCIYVITVPHIPYWFEWISILHPS